MTRLRNLALGGLAALAITGVASQALAAEPGNFENRLTGASIGIPLGAAPPPGIYTGLETAYLGMVGNGGWTTGNFFIGGRVTLPAIAQAVPLLWVPGWNFLGATYSASVVQAFYEAANCGNIGCNGPLGLNQNNNTIGSAFMFANTTWTPISLSWNLGQGWFVSASFTFMAPDGTKDVSAANPDAVQPNPDYWTFEPGFAIAYLANNWAISANFFYDINTSSQGLCCLFDSTYTTGNLFYGDLAALYKFGKWSIGPVASFEVQTTADTTTSWGPGGCTAANAAAAAGFYRIVVNPYFGNGPYCGSVADVAIGGLIGYDFGPVDFQLWITDTIVAQDFAEGVGGINIFTRLGFKLWGPEAAKPLVAKN